MISMFVGVVLIVSWLSGVGVGVSACVLYAAEAELLSEIVGDLTLSQLGEGVLISAVVGSSGILVKNESWDARELQADRGGSSMLDKVVESLRTGEGVIRNLSSGASLVRPACNCLFCTTFSFLLLSTTFSEPGKTKIHILLCDSIKVKKKLKYVLLTIHNQEQEFPTLLIC